MDVSAIIARLRGRLLIPLSRGRISGGILWGVSPIVLLFRGDSEGDRLGDYQRGA